MQLSFRTGLSGLDYAATDRHSTLLTFSFLTADTVLFIFMHIFDSIVVRAHMRKQVLIVYVHCIAALVAVKL